MAGYWPDRGASGLPDWYPAPKVWKLRGLCQVLCVFVVFRCCIFFWEPEAREEVEAAGRYFCFIQADRCALSSVRSENVCSLSLRAFKVSRIHSPVCWSQWTSLFYNNNILYVLKFFSKPLTDKNHTSAHCAVFKCSITAGKHGKWITMLQNQSETRIWVLGKRWFWWKFCKIFCIFVNLAWQLDCRRLKKNYMK